MTKLYILDTGYLTSERDGTQKSGTDIHALNDYIAYGGLPITLISDKMSLKAGLQIADEPNPSSGDATQTHFNSFDNELYEVPFIIDITSATDRTLLKEIRVLHKTKGVKLLYASTITDNQKMMVELLGRTDTRFNTSIINSQSLAGIPVFVCRVKGISLNQVANVARNYQITGSLTIEEEQVIV